MHPDPCVRRASAYIYPFHVLGSERIGPVEEPQRVPWGQIDATVAALEAKGVVATLLLCAGTFTNLTGTKPIYKPFNIGCGLLGALDMKAIGLIAPVVEQEIAIKQRWETMGWETTVWTADLGNQDQAFHRQLDARIHARQLDCIVLDYVGHPLEYVNQLQRSIEQPVIDLGYLAMVTLASTL